MKVYVVSGYDLDWKDNLPPRVFSNKEDAEAYYKKVRHNLLETYDIFETELETELKGENI